MVLSSRNGKSVDEFEGRPPKESTPPALSEGKQFPKGYWMRIVPRGAALSLDGRFLQYESANSEESRYITTVDLATGDVVESTPAHLHRGDSSIATLRFITGDLQRTFADYREDYMIATGRPMEAQQGEIRKRMGQVIELGSSKNKKNPAPKKTHRKRRTGTDG